MGDLIHDFLGPKRRKQNASEMVIDTSPLPHEMDKQVPYTDQASTKVVVTSNKESSDGIVQIPDTLQGKTVRAVRIDNFELEPVYDNSTPSQPLANALISFEYNGTVGSFLLLNETDVQRIRGSCLNVGQPGWSAKYPIIAPATQVIEKPSTFDTSLSQWGSHMYEAVAARLYDAIVGMGETDLEYVHVSFDRRSTRVRIELDYGMATGARSFNILTQSSILGTDVVDMEMGRARVTPPASASTLEWFSSCPPQSSVIHMCHVRVNFVTADMVVAGDLSPHQSIYTAMLGDKYMASTYKSDYPGVTHQIKSSRPMPPSFHIAVVTNDGKTIPASIRWRLSMTFFE